MKRRPHAFVWDLMKRWKCYFLFIIISSHFHRSKVIHFYGNLPFCVSHKLTHSVEWVKYLCFFLWGGWKWKRKAMKFFILVNYSRNAHSREWKEKKQSFFTKVKINGILLWKKPNWLFFSSGILCHLVDKNWETKEYNLVFPSRCSLLRQWKS